MCFKDDREEEEEEEEEALNTYALFWER